MIIATSKGIFGSYTSTCPALRKHMSHVCTRPTWLPNTTMAQSKSFSVLIESFVSDAMSAARHMVWEGGAKLGGVQALLSYCANAQAVQASLVAHGKGSCHLQCGRWPSLWPSWPLPPRDCKSLLPLGNSAHMHNLGRKFDPQKTDWPTGGRTEGRAMDDEP